MGQGEPVQHAADAPLDGSVTRRFSGFFFVIDILLPFIWLCSALGWVIRTTDHHTDNLYGGLTHLHGDIAPFLAIVTLTVLTSTLSMCLRQQRHLEQVPSDVFRMPFFVMFSTLVLMPIRMVGFVRLAHQGSWGTRENAYDSGDSGPAVDDVLHGAPPGPGGSSRDVRAASGGGSRRFGRSRAPGCRVGIATGCVVAAGGE